MVVAIFRQKQFPEEEEPCIKIKENGKFQSKDLFYLIIVDCQKCHIKNLFGELMVNLLTPNFLDCLSSTLTQSQCQ